MSSVLYRAHSVQSERNSLVVPVMYVLFQTVDEFVHRFKLLAVEHFNFQSSEEVFHCSVIHAVSFSGHALNLFNEDVFDILKNLKNINS